MFYAVKVGRKPGIYENKNEALEQVSGFPLNEMKRFSKKKEALKYLKEEKVSNFFYVVKNGKNPGIYFSKEEVSIQIKGVENPLVRTFKDKAEAEKFLEMDISDISIKNKKLDKINKEAKRKSFLKKIDRYLNEGISIHSRYVCFIDVEANEGKAVSLGAIIYDSESKEIIDKFYSLMRYSGFVEMDYFSKRVNNLETEDILNALDSDTVFKNFIEFVNKYEIIDIYAWGNNDKHFLIKSLEDKELISKINPIRNIQTIISYITKDFVFNETWSLKHMKQFYGLGNDITHNSLKDAEDLCRVFESFQAKKEICKEVLLEHQK